ncbi:MAG TPA: outer membrane protein assembly factor BamA [Phycisphaerales bacterium]|nr:outer membrane protein assembly factor BamA [Phycisphaerales bacterium]
MASPLALPARATGRLFLRSVFARSATWRVLCALAACTGLPYALNAQTVETAPPAPASIDPALEAFAGRPVRQVIFQKPGPANADGSAGAPVAVDVSLEELSRNQLRLREGLAFDPAIVTDDLSRLNRLGRFRTVRADVQPLADGGVTIVYTVRPQPVITAVQTVGNTELNDAELSRQIGLLEGTAVDRTQLDRAARRIEGLYREEGFYNALVTIDEKELEDTGAVVFRVREGVRTAITAIRFVGNNSISDDELDGQIESNVKSLLLRKGLLDNDKLEDDVAKIVKYYKDRGYIDVRVGTIVTPSQDGTQAIVEFVIEEGAVSVLRDVKVVYAQGDDEVYTPAQLVGLMPLKPGSIYRDDLLKKSIEAVQAAYGKLGYADVKVNRRELRAQDGTNQVDLLLQIDEGRRFRTGVVEVIGNRLTRDDVVRRHVLLKPDRPLDATVAKETQTRLEKLNLFAPRSVEVAIQPENPDNPGYRDVVVEVAETNTGSFNIGATAGSDGGIAGLFSITQRNFDVSDTPDTVGEFFSGDAFRGGGQTFNILLSPGDRVRNFQISLTEPSMFDTDFSGSGRVYLRQRIYGAYDEERMGGQFTLGRRFGSLWTVAAPIRLEQVEISDIDADAPTEYFDDADSTFLNSVGITLTRTSVDRNTFPTAGYRIEGGIEQFGLLGDEQFTVLNGELAQYFELEEDVLGRSTTLLLRTRASYIPGAEDVAPFYERLYLGGQNFRGFALRGASPVGIRNDTGGVSDDAVGGNWLFFAGAELTKPLYQDFLAGVLFVDTGTVERDFGFSEYRASVGFGFRLVIPQLSNVPLAFDFGFPILKEDTDRDRLFTFTLELPFN